MNNENIKVVKLYHDFRVDFHKLALLSPSLRPHLLILGHRAVINFKHQATLIKLTQAIIEHIFHFRWSLPEDCLCPRVPSRLNYLIWVAKEAASEIKSVVDIGTGASLIYPLLGWRMFGWHFIALEADNKSYNHARQICECNQLTHQINLKLSPSGCILLGTLEPNVSADIVICNPPFFEEERESLSAMRANQHHTEMGEYGFLFQIYRESFHFKGIKEFSCLLGLRGSYESAKIFLGWEKSQGVLQSCKFGEIHQGNCVRFIVMWAPLRSDKS